MKIHSQLLPAYESTGEITVKPVTRYGITADNQLTVLAYNDSADAGQQLKPLLVIDRINGNFNGTFFTTSDLIVFRANDKDVNFELWEEDVAGFGEAGSPSSDAQTIQGADEGFPVNTKDQVGVAGGAVYSDTSVRNGLQVTAIQVISDAVFTTLTGNLTGFSGVTFPAGTVIRGYFTAITLASGTIIAYNI
jgi:hypothetical protein